MPRPMIILAGGRQLGQRVFPSSKGPVGGATSGPEARRTATLAKLKHL
jgi:hypothetical protein